MRFHVNRIYLNEKRISNQIKSIEVKSAAFVANDEILLLFFFFFWTDVIEMFKFIKYQISHAFKVWFCVFFFFFVMLPNCKFYLILEHLFWVAIWKMKNNGFFFCNRKSYIYRRLNGLQKCLIKKAKHIQIISIFSCYLWTLLFHFAS